MLKKEMDMIARINKLLSALVEGDLSSRRLPKDLGEFEETFLLLTQVTTSLKDISQQARMTAVADTYNALTSDRPYRDGMAQEKALQIVEEAKGTQLCPDCVAVFLKWITTDDAVRATSRYV